PRPGRLAGLGGLHRARHRDGAAACLRAPDRDGVRRGRVLRTGAERAGGLGSGGRRDAPAVGLRRRRRNALVVSAPVGAVGGAAQRAGSLLVRSPWSLVALVCHGVITASAAFARAQSEDALAAAAFDR